MKRGNKPYPGKILNASWSSFQFSLLMQYLIFGGVMFP